MKELIAAKIVELYTWFWHDVCHTDKPFTFIIINNIRQHEIAWTFGGAMVLTALWTMIIHLIVTL